MKLYCECFSRNGYCSSNCKCLNCKNNLDYRKARDDCIEEIRKRKPEAFVVNKGEVENRNGEGILISNKRSCNCKKTKCLKKYCDCYTGGSHCNSDCKCEDCQN